MRFAIVTVLLTLLWTPSATGGFAVQRVTFRTDDGVTLSGSWFEPSVRPAPAVVLVHMYRRSRHDWALRSCAGFRSTA